MMQKQSEVLSLHDEHSVNIEFENLSYSVPVGARGSKVILNNVNGKFNAGQLTAIMGASGSGKTTLLNILAAHKFQETGGTVYVNNAPRDVAQFRKISRYILQENFIQPFMSLEETMMTAAHFKLGIDAPMDMKTKAVSDIMDLLGLTGAKETWTNTLSGGEKKRLFIALELINNPSVIFLDEPTSGLDDVASSQCISILKRLANDGKTIVCSIHAPSSKIFSQFDRVYVVSLGECVYQGNGAGVVPYLSSIGLTCPILYNPADFMLEVCSEDYGNFQKEMVSAIDNGRNIIIDGNLTPMLDDVPKSDKAPRVYEAFQASTHQNSSWQEFKILLLRIWLLEWRNKPHQLLKLVTHTVVGFFIGYLNLGLGKDASKTVQSHSFYIMCVCFFMYVALMPVVLWFSFEIKYLKREFFNEWYRLGPYLWALTISTIPMHLLSIAAFAPWVYLLAAQPLELVPILGFVGICFLSAIISETVGLFVAALVSMSNATMVGPLSMALPTMIAFYGLGEHYTELSVAFRLIMRTSYIRLAFEAMALVMMQDRKVDCPESKDYCLYTNLNDFIEEMCMGDAVLWVDITALIFIWVMLRISACYCLQQRLIPNRVFRFFKQITYRKRNAF